jgi:hypothetical protein
MAERERPVNREKMAKWTRFAIAPGTLHIQSFLIGSQLYQNGVIDPIDND